MLLKCQLLMSFQKCYPILCLPQHSCGVNGRIWVVVPWCLSGVGLELCILWGSAVHHGCGMLGTAVGCGRTPRVGCCSPDFRIVKSHICTHCVTSGRPDHKGAFLYYMTMEVAEINLERNYPFSQINWLYLWIQLLSCSKF